MTISSISVTLADNDAWSVQVLKPDELVQRTVVCIDLELGDNARLTLFFHTTESLISMIAALHEGAGLLTP